jgi:hypothetical protein
LKKIRLIPVPVQQKKEETLDPVLAKKFRLLFWKSDAILVSVPGNPV